MLNGMNPFSIYFGRMRECEIESAVVQNKDNLD